jgi:hypothetical protein
MPRMATFYSGDISELSPHGMCGTVTHTKQTKPHYPRIVSLSDSVERCTAMSVHIRPLLIHTGRIRIRKVKYKVIRI